MAVLRDPDCNYCRPNISIAIDTRSLADRLCRHLRDVHAGDMAAVEIRSNLDVRAMTSGPPKFRNRWTPPKST